LSRRPLKKEPRNIEVKNMIFFLQKRLLFGIPCSVFDIQNAKQAKAARLKGEGFEPDEWKKEIEDFKISANRIPTGRWIVIDCEAEKNR
jgi:hypothetical protein